MNSSNQLELFKNLTITEAAIRAREDLDSKKRNTSRQLDYDALHQAFSGSEADLGVKAKALADFFLKAHDHVLTDSSQYSKIREATVFRSSELTEAEKRGIEERSRAFLTDMEAHKGCFETDKEQIAYLLQEFYGALTGVRLAHVEIAAGLTLSAWGDTPEIKGDRKRPGMLPNGIDFSRAEKDASLEQRFLSAISKDRASLKRKQTRYIHHPESYYAIAGLRFMAWEYNGLPHILSAKGYLLNPKQDKVFKLQGGGLLVSQKSVQELVSAGYRIAQKEPVGGLEQVISSVIQSGKLPGGEVVAGGIAGLTLIPDYEADHLLELMPQTERQRSEEARRRLEEIERFRKLGKRIPADLDLWADDSREYGRIKQRLERMATSDFVDGMRIDPCAQGVTLGGASAASLHRAAPLATTDIDQLTGLRRDVLATAMPEKKSVNGNGHSKAPQSERDAFLSWLANDKHVSLLDLYGDLPQLQRNLRLKNFEKLTGEKRLEQRERLTEHLYAQRIQPLLAGSPYEMIGKRLAAQLAYIWERSDSAFVYKDAKGKVKDKAPSHHPWFTIPQGPFAVGKTVAEEAAKKRSDDMLKPGQESGAHLVRCSRDDGRKESDLLAIYQGTANHNDDYLALEQFSGVLRDLTATRAMQGKYHLLYDGTGLPYAHRYDALVEQAKEQGYKTSLIAVHAPYYAQISDEERRALEANKLSKADALVRLGNRQAETHRIIPMQNTEEIHRKFPGGFLNAVKDPNLDEVILVNNAYKHPYILAYRMRIGGEAIQELKNIGGEAFFKGHRDSWKLQYGEAHTRRESANHPATMLLPAPFRHVSGEGNDNAYFKVVREAEDKQSYDLLVVEDLKSLLAHTQKGLFDTSLKGPESVRINTLAFDAKGDFQKTDNGLSLETEALQDVNRYDFKNLVTVGRRVSPPKRAESLVLTH